MWDISSIFFEKQEGSLCAKHCLNATLQGSYFTAVDLAELANRLDEEERQQMSESGIESEDYRRFLEQPSGNMDDTGYFSVQVISKALELWNLELVPLNSTDEYAKDIGANPSKARAFILHMENHWFCIRKFRIIDQSTERIGFFNLNSMSSKPEYMSPLYLAEYLKTMQNEGYLIFIVKGEFPECPSDSNPPRLKARVTQFVDLTKSDSTASTTSEADEEMQRAIELSLRSNQPPRVVPSASTSSIDSELERALNMSMECFVESPMESTSSVNPDEVRNKRLAFFDSSSTKDK